jgi:bis(5'-nucleosidyl)-tetraphosphatase
MRVFIKQNIIIMTSKRIAAGIILFRKDRPNIEYLLLQTSYGEHHWTPPKGHLDEGENELETAIRETKEESGLDIDLDYKIIDLKHRIELNYLVDKNKQKCVYYWIARLEHLKNPKVKLSDEHIDFKWADLEKAVELAKFNDMQEALRNSEKFIKENGFDV